MAKEWTHAALVARAYRWLKNGYNCLIAFTEAQQHVTGETPDAIGWKRNGRSVMVECKMSRGDFLADKHKPFRQNPVIALGAERYYLTIPGIIQPNELPPDWGLLEVKGNSVKVIVPARPRKDLRSETGLKNEIQYLTLMLHRAQARLGAAQLNEWLKWENKDESPVSMQKWVSPDDVTAEDLTRNGFTPVVNVMELPVNDADGEYWCPLHDAAFYLCPCVASGDEAAEFRVFDGVTYGRKALVDPELYAMLTACTSPSMTRTSSATSS